MLATITSWLGRSARAQTPSRPLRSRLAVEGLEDLLVAGLIADHHHIGFESQGLPDQECGVVMGR